MTYELAVIDEDKHITWSELRARAGEMARGLHGPTPVLINRGRSAEMVIAVAACLQAQVPFILVDADIPAERLAWITADASANPQPEAMYHMYTSGSSGRPKGTAIPRRGIEQLLPAMLERIPVLAGTRRIGLTASLSFDAALQQILLALHIGATLVIPGDRTRRDGESLLRFWAQHRVEVADGTPTLLRILAATPRTAIPAHVPHTLLIGGEPLRATDLAGLGLDTDVYNLYGVAECGINSAIGLAVPGDFGGVLPVGPPLAHNRLLILDEAGLPVLEGEPGEVYIAGASVGLGYPSLPDETAARFVEVCGEPAYRTGDCGLLLPDGRLLVTGRLDRQIKVGGRRVEPAEIESLILEYVRQREPVRRAAMRSATAADVRRCAHCALSDRYPGADFDHAGVCRFCRFADDDIRSGWGYFRTEADLTTELTGAQALVLFSGGKDSTYALHKLRDLGMPVVAFTFDNGYISQAAFTNIRRTCAELGVPHHVGKPGDRIGLLAEGLRTEATVCSGCFRGITGIAEQVAAELGCSHIITGLSRAQIIETKLLQFLRRSMTDLSNVDEELTRYYRLYLGATQAVRSIDLFRYDASPPHAVRTFLADRDPAWRAPTDTGMCSTNCRANDAGIEVHLERRGYHNYEGPLSWDVRLGQLSRDEALASITAGREPDNVNQVLGDISRRLDVAVTSDERGMLSAFVEYYDPIDAADLTSWMQKRTPAYMIPRRVITLDRLPRLPSGKVDSTSLQARAPHTDSMLVLDDSLSQEVALQWNNVLGRKPGSADADFFGEGGDSLAATELAAGLAAALGVAIPARLVFDAPSFADMCREIRDIIAGAPCRSDGTPGGERKRSPARKRIVTFSPLDRISAHGAPALYLFPGLSGHGVPLQEVAREVRSLLDRELELIVVQFNAESAEQPSAILREMATHIGERADRTTVAIMGWSFGAVLADRVLTRISRPIVGLLLDPPVLTPASMDARRADLRDGLARAFPQLFGAHTQQTWEALAGVIGRACSYQDGPHRVYAALPPELQYAVAGGTPNLHELLTSGLHMLAELEADRPETTDTRAVRHLIKGPDHFSIINREYAPQYAELIRQSSSRLG